MGKYFYQVGSAHAPVRMQMVVWRVTSHFTEHCMQAAQWVECSVYAL